MERASSWLMCVFVAIYVGPCIGKTFYSPYRSGGVNYPQFNMHAEGIDITSVTSVKFQTKGKNDAHILLQYDRNNYYSNIIEVVIGGWGNSKSVIRNSQQGSARDEHRESGILSTSSYRWFWISWANNCIKVGKGSSVGSSEIMSWCGLSHTISGLRISYGYSSDGYWIFEEAVNGGWTSWSNWAGCSVTCGSASQSRSRSCTNPAPSGGGSSCSGSTTDSGTCTLSACPIDGGFTSWSSWDTCTLTCGTGTQNRARSCTNPAAQHGGAPCVGDTSETQNCNTHYCPIDGNWATWNAWGSCSLTCGTGSQERLRTCTDPSPQHNGATCPGSGAETMNCNTHSCPIDGGFTSWSSWDTCTLTCGTGTQNRARSCTNPAAQHGGAPCVGDTSETQNCNTHYCPIDGNWATWNAWGSCSLTCGTGSQERLRTCTDPSPQHNGATCPGSGAETMNCNTHSCPIDGGFTSWSSWDTCTLTCGTGTQNRARSCTNPAAQHGGAPCVGDTSETQNCNTHYCPIDGGWTTWTGWTACGVTCSDVPVYQTRNRTCTDPAPQYLGADCPGDADEATTCVLNPCPVDGNWGSWNSYGACSASCLGGWRNRTRDCNNPTSAWGGLDCVGDTWQTDYCNDIACNVAPPVDGNWGNWDAWQGCSVTCGNGVQRRYRNCDNPVPDHGGAPCFGDSFGENVCSGGGSCPVSVDGNWGAWSSLSSCSVTCGQGRASKFRYCDSPAPSNGGSPCSGDTMVMETCIDQACNSGGYGASYYNTCPVGYFTCYSGGITCIQEFYACDCLGDCTDDSDENELWAGCSVCMSAADTHGIAVVVTATTFLVHMAFKNF